MGLAHVVDWYATFATLAGVSGEAIADSTVGLPKTESISLWAYINGAESESPRDEIVLDHHMFTEASSMNGTCAGQAPFTVPGVSALGALRQGDWKLIVGPEDFASWYAECSSVCECARDCITASLSVGTACFPRI